MKQVTINLRNVISRHYLVGFTLVELLTVLGVISVLAAVAFPVIFRVRESTRGIACLSNMKQLGTAVALYLQDYDETFPMSRLPDADHSITGCTAQGNEPEDGLQGSSLNWKRALDPYIKNRAVFQCPSNGYAWLQSGFNAAPGDETNPYYPSDRQLPCSYGFNGSFFHEAVPPCWYGEHLVRPRFLIEISDASRLITLLESRYGFPDLGGWFIPLRSPNDSHLGAFQSHNGACNWLFADWHAKRLKLSATCSGKMWTDRFVDRSGGCEQIRNVADEYK